jgi:predicted metal-dependent phosphoesterase TrpH
MVAAEWPSDDHVAGKESNMIDLHMHSTFSDGSLTPAQLAAEAGKARLSAVALTDHDGTSGVQSFLDACSAVGVRGISGVELSVDFKGGTMHMLGYFIDHASAGIEAELVKLREGRRDRNHLILAKLNELGVLLTWDEVAAYADEDVVGRPHFAQAMKARGYVKSKDEAFDRYLGKGKPAYMERYRLTAAESVNMIRAAGGVPVLAHPFTLGLNKRALREQVAELAAMGLQGIEAYYVEHGAGDLRFCLEMARELNLAVSGGSDFHGAMNPDVRMGCGFGNLSVPDDLVERLYERATRH